jgi:putative FmdB family regulatory protein
MPTYDYECRGCSHEFEARQPITQDPLRDCPECKKSLLTRKIGTGSLVQFKGSGFYETDYKRKAKKP